jgi:predicted ATP-dependent endonuclease of OLD family
LSNRSPHKYASNPTGKNVTDFEGLLKLLYAKDAVHAKMVRTAAESNQYSKEHFEPSQLQRLKSIWENILPHRQLDIELTGELKAKQTTITGEIFSYMSSGMSDGERVMFYLLGKCLVAPENAILIIDEPEIHLHPTVRDALWSSIETERSDCKFIYITHDIAFACGRMEELAVWLKSFDGTNWRI